MIQRHTVFFYMPETANRLGFEWLPDETAYYDVSDGETAVARLLADVPRAIVTDVYLGHHGLNHPSNIPHGTNGKYAVVAPGW